MLERIKAIFQKPAPVEQTKVVSIETLFNGVLSRVPLSQFSNYESYLRSASNRLWSLWKCCDLIASQLVDTPWKVQRIGGDGTPVQVPGLNSLLEAPNRTTSWEEVIYLSAFHFLLTGNAFWFKDQANVKGDQPGEIYVLNPRSIRLAVDPKLGIVGYLYSVNGVEIPFDVSQVIHFKRPHPNNEFWGLGNAEASEKLYQQVLDRDAWMGKWWANGASPSGVLIFKEKAMDKKQFEEAKIRWQDQYGGPGNAGKTAWLTGDVTYTQLGLTIQEMQNIESSKWDVEQIAASNGVPLSVLGLKDVANYATAQLDEIRFRRYTVKPICTWFASTINSDLVVGFNPGMEFVFNISGLIDVQYIAEYYTKLFNCGAITPNELREMVGLKRSDEALLDRFYLATTVAPIELAGLVPDAPAPPSGDPSAPAQPKKRLTLEERQAREIVDRHNGRLIAELSAHGAATP